MGALSVKSLFNPIALRKAKIVYNFGLSECSRVNVHKLLNEKDFAPLGTGFKHAFVNGKESLCYIAGVTEYLLASASLLESG